MIEGVINCCRCVGIVVHPNAFPYVCRVSLGLDVELWGAADEQQPVQQDDIWDAIHGFYDE